MSYRSKIKICGIKSAAEARAVLACSSALYANLERADGAKNLPQSGGESSMKTPNFCGENSRRNFNLDSENSTRNFNSYGQNFAQNFNQGGKNFTCRAQSHANFTPEQNSDCDKNFSSDSRSQGDGSGARVEFLGVIFVSSSKRRVSVETARKIARIAHQNGVKCVGVFALSCKKHGAAACECKNFSGKACGDEICKDKIYAGTSGSVEFYEAAEFCEKQREDLSVNLNANPDAPASIKDLNSEIFGAEALNEGQILKICEICELDCAQIYGRISADFKARLNAAGIEAWQVLSIGAEMPPLEGLSCDRILFDAKGASLGGNGVSFDWDLLRRAGLGYEGRDGAMSDEKCCAGSTAQTRDGKKCDSASGRCDTQNDAASDEKCYVTGMVQDVGGIRSYLKHSAIYSGYSEENLKRDTNGSCGNSCAEHSENGNLKLKRVSNMCCASNSNEASKRAHDIVIRSGNTTQETSANRRAAKNDDGCKFSACATARLSGVRPTSEGVNNQGANDYEAGALNISNDGSEVGKLGAAKDDSADKCSTASKGGAISFILAGGIGAQNIREALALRPYAIDLNSRVEDARGIKDPQKISEILQILKNVQG
jgi:phosphoribosylanthranilate isomerase